MVAMESRKKLLGEIVAALEIKSTAVVVIHTVRNLQQAFNFEMM
jgi:hypothetical protein